MLVGLYMQKTEKIILVCHSSLNYLCLNDFLMRTHVLLTFDREISIEKILHIGWSKRTQDCAYWKYIFAKSIDFGL